MRRPPVLDDGPPPPGQMAVVMAALSIGLLLMGIQLWLLTVALELYMSGERGREWQLAVVSGAIFAGGLLVLWVLRRRPDAAPRIGPLPAPGSGWGSSPQPRLHG